MVQLGNHYALLGKAEIINKGASWKNKVEDWAGGAGNIY